MNSFIEWLRTCEYQLKVIINKAGSSPEIERELARIVAALELHEEWQQFKR